MPEKTVAALKADKAKKVLFGKQRAEVPEHVRPEAVMLHVLRSQSGTKRRKHLRRYVRCWRKQTLTALASIL